MRKTALVAMVALALAACQSTSPTANFAVPKGEPRQIFAAYSLAEDCSSLGDATVRITQAPEHGTIRIKDGPVHTNFAPTNPRHVCNERAILGKQVWYEPAPGYNGSDAVTLDMIYANGGEQVRTFAIDVR